MSGLYMPKATHSVPPLMPGMIAPKPTMIPSSTQRIPCRTRKFFITRFSRSRAGHRVGRSRAAFPKDSILLNYTIEFI